MGGIPSEIFELESLEELSLSHQNIQFIPAAISRLKKLRELNLERCLCLESLPGSMGCMEQLQSQLEIIFVLMLDKHTHTHIYTYLHTHLSLQE